MSTGTLLRTTICSASSWRWTSWRGPSPLSGEDTLPGFVSNGIAGISWAFLDTQSIHLFEHFIYYLPIASYFQLYLKQYDHDLQWNYTTPFDDIINDYYTQKQLRSTSDFQVKHIGSRLRPWNGLNLARIALSSIRDISGVEHEHEAAKS